VSTWVTVGNCYQPFTRLLEEVERLAASGQLPVPVLVQNGHTAVRAPHCILLRFVDRAEFERQVAASNLMISHAGAGAVLQGVRAGRVPVVMPRLAAAGEHVDDHQVETAKALEASARVVVAMEAEELARAVEKAMRAQSRPRPRPNLGKSPLVQRIRQTLEAWDAGVMERHSRP